MRHRVSPPTINNLAQAGTGNISRPTVSQIHASESSPAPSSSDTLGPENTNFFRASVDESDVKKAPYEAKSDPPKHLGLSMSGYRGDSTGITSRSGSFTGSNFARDGVSVANVLGQSGVQFATDAAGASASIGQTVAKSGLDMSVSVVGGTADLTGTAIGGIIQIATETSGKSFEPVGCGLQAIEGFSQLGNGLAKINGLPVAAVKQVGEWTIQALNVSGKIPTFFDTSGAGVVDVLDTTKGLIVLGLDEKSAKYAAYALHVMFSYPTGSSWVPTDTALPIVVENMGRTRWGRNWGQYDRIDWVRDVDIDQVFVESDQASWREKLKEGRRYFGVLLLVFEWGTTWPFMMPAHEIPFKGEIGEVIRKLILPTILSNFRRAREDELHVGSKPQSQEAPTGPNQD